MWNVFILSYIRLRFHNYTPPSPSSRLCEGQCVARDNVSHNTTSDNEYSIPHFYLSLETVQDCLDKLQACTKQIPVASNQ